MPTPNLAGLLAKPTPARRVHALTEPAMVQQAEMANPAFDAAPTEQPEPAVAEHNGQLPVAGESTIHPTGSSDERQYLRSITVYIPRSMHRAVGIAARERKTTRTALMLAALNATHQQLGEVLAANKPPARKQDLFAVPQTRTAAEPSVQTTIRVTDSQFEAIENLVAEHATNRSRLVTAALQIYLPPTGG